MINWLITNLDEVLGLVLGFTTGGAFWFAYKGRNGTAGIIGLSGNAMWWAYAYVVGTVTLMLPIAVLTFIHSYNLRKSYKSWREHKRKRKSNAETNRVVESIKAAGGWCAPSDYVLDLYNSRNSGSPCPVCTHLFGGHGEYGCTIITGDGRPCGCVVTPTATEPMKDS